MTTSDDATGRKLAAIMFTDIKGFSRKMGENESAAFELLKTHDAIMRVLTAKYGGKVIKSIGDSFMVDFASAVNAVKCAIDAQKRFWNFNKGKSEFDRIEIRVGIHLGDVIVRGDDIFGDGVNIASRVEAITDPTRICISHDVYVQVKNKMPLNVYKMGALELKNIAEPVEIYEILIDSIPELSTPSASARQKITAKAAEVGEQREQEEADEAKKVEELRKSAEQKEATAEGKQKAIDGHYTKAEKFFQLGRMAEAEKELGEIYKLDPDFEATQERRKQEESHEREAQTHLKNARMFLTQGNLDAAEAQINEVFRYFPLNIGAQQMLMQVEDERYKQQEAKRAVVVAPSAKEVVLTEDEKKIQELLAKTRELTEQQEFKEAIFTLREAFKIDPNNDEARRVEESVRLAEQAKIELDRVEAEHEEERIQSDKLALLQKKLERKKQAQEMASQEREKTKSRKMIWLGVGVGILVLIGISIPFIKKAYFPKTVTVAVLRFAEEGDFAAANGLGQAVTILLSDELARNRLTQTTSWMTSLTFEASPSRLPTIAGTLLVRYVVTGTVQTVNDSLYVKLRLIDMDDQKTLLSARFGSTFASFGSARTDILHIIASTLDYPEIPEPHPFTSNADACRQFLAALAKLPSNAPMEMDEAVRRFATASGIDPKFMAAKEYHLLAALKASGMAASAMTTEQVSADAKALLKVDEANAAGLLTLGTLAFQRDDFPVAAGYMARALTAMPHSAAAHRYAALCAVTSGNIELAARSAQMALTLNSKDAETNLTSAIVRHLRKEYGDAVRQYAQVVALGENDSIITAEYVVPAWLGDDKFEKVIKYSESVSGAAPRDYRYRYGLGRALQMATKIEAATDALTEGLKLADKALEEAPDDATARMYMALFYSRLGKFNEGQQAMKQALKDGKESATLLYRAADVCAIQKNHDQALNYLKSALSKDYRFQELLNPDLFYISRTAEFLSLVAIEGSLTE